MQNAKCLIITGMPRSGASVVAQALFRAGLYLGDRFKDASLPRPDGFLEDQDIVQFHNELLAINQAKRPACATLDDLTVPDDYASKAVELINLKFEKHAPWGWKDSRTTLFLNLWNATLPDARWVFVFREPAQVVWSLLSRRDLEPYSTNPLARALMAVRLWTHYNARIVAFACRNRDRALLIFTPHDFEENRQTILNDVILGQWSSKLQCVDLSGAYYSHLMRKTAPGWVRWLTKTHLPAQVMFWKLRRLHDELLVQHVGKERLARAIRGKDLHEGGTEPVVCIISPRKYAYSETFIKNRIKRLPAEVKLLYGGWFPVFTEDGRPFLSLFGRSIDLILRKAFRVNTRGLLNLALRRYLRREKVQAVLAEYCLTAANVMEACKNEGIPLIVHFHGRDAYDQALLEKNHVTYRQIFAAAAAMIAVSREMEQHLSRLGAPRDKLFYNPTGADISLFTGADPAASPAIFLAVGRFVDKKAPHLTLLAFKKVVEACPDARLVMIGDGALAEACKQLTRALAIEDAVTFLGARSHVEVAAAMRTVRGLVLHSITTSYGDLEGTPNVVLEAGAAGLPVVSTRHAGIKDVVIDGETGFLVDEGDIQGMADHTIALARDPGLAARLGRRAQERIRANFSMDKGMTNLWAVIEDVMRN